MRSIHETMRVLLAVVLAGALVIGVLAPVAAQQQRDTGERVPLGDILDNPDDFIDQQVTVTTEVQEILTNRALTLGGEDVDDELLVLGARRAMQERLSENALVRVTGTVRFFDPETLQEEENLNISFDDDAFDNFNEDDPVIVASRVQLLVPAMGEMIEDIVNNPEEFIGEQVMVLGRVANNLDAPGFTLEGPSGFLGISQNNLLVIGQRNVMRGLGLTDDAVVQVRGTVRFFDPETLEDEENLGIDFEDNAFDDFNEDDPVIVADQVTVLATERGRTVEDILNDPDAFVGQRVTVAGNINEVLTGQAFTLEGTSGLVGLTGENLLVIGSQRMINRARLDDDVIVVVQGTVHFFDPAAIEEEEGIDFDEDDEVFDDFNDDDPVIVASRVTPIATESGN